MLGIDVVNVERLRGAMARSPGLERRLFSEEEISYCRGKQDPSVHFAGTLAAKEAVIKALRLGPLMAWARRIEITRDGDGVPRVRIDGTVPAVEISIAHDHPVAVATALELSPGG